jgi:hypothetical protein
MYFNTKFGRNYPTIYIMVRSVTGFLEGPLERPFHYETKMVGRPFLAAIFK